MSYKNLAAIVLGLVILAIVTVVLLPPAPETEQLPAYGSHSILEMGNADQYGYLTFNYSGTGSISLSALSAKPKNKVIILKKDFLGTERYSYFVDYLAPLNESGFNLTEVEAIDKENGSIIVIPCGAMPKDVLSRLDELARSNTVIYIGKTNLVYTDRLVQSDWLPLVSNATKPKLIIIEKTLEEFYSDKNSTLFEDIERNSWAELNYAEFNYSGDGTRTVFIDLNNATWLLELPSGNYSELKPRAAKMTGNDSIFLWEKAALTIALNFSSGTSMYSVERDGVRVSGGELDRVRGEEAFYIPVSFPEAGDYLVRVYDEGGTMGIKRIHVRDLNISLSSAYGNFFEFSVSLDGAPVPQASGTIGLNHSNNSLPIEVRNGRFSINANLRQGDNVFVMELFGSKHYLLYLNNQESVLAFYAKYLSIGVLGIAIFYAVLRLSKRPVYRILVPEIVQGTNPEIKVSAKDVLSTMKETEKRFGWKNVPLSIKEVAYGLRKFSNGMEVNEVHVEAIMKELEINGAVKSHLALFGLPEWGNPQHNALKRLVRDKLIQSGVSFSEKPFGFKCPDWNIVFSPEKAAKGSLVVFEDKESRDSYLSSLQGKAKAEMELKTSNGVVRLCSIEELDELL